MARSTPPPIWILRRHRPTLVKTSVSVAAIGGYVDNRQSIDALAVRTQADGAVREAVVSTEFPEPFDIVFRIKTDKAKVMEPAGSHGLEAIYRLSHAELLRFLIARTGDKAEADDLMQELWIKIQQVPSGPIGNGRAYIYRMAQNLMVDRLRARQRRQRREHAWYGDHRDPNGTGAEPHDPGRNAEEALLDREEIALVASAIANLPPGARRAFELHKIRGLSHSEVAQELGISRSGVEKHMTVAMKYLRRALLD